MKLIAIALSSLALSAPAARAALPPNFFDELVTAVGQPTALAFTPDGRMLITRQTGTLRVFQNGALLPTPAITFPSASICTNFERGLLGVAVDPLFETNRFVYLFYTHRVDASSCSGSTTPRNRVSRFVLPATNVIDPASEVILVDNMPSPNGNHNAGDVQFGRDGFLYISVGDGGCDYASGCGSSGGANDAARDQHTLIGKVLRITRDGGIPAGNPFQGAGTARCNVTGGTTAGNRCQETFAWGLRNPFRLAFDPNAAGTRFFINDVGQNQREEIDLGQAGADYGWNCREGSSTNNTTGPCNPTPAGMVAPVYEYEHGEQIPGTTSPSSCNAITGGAFVPNGLWPGYDGTYIFSDYTCGWMVRLSAAGPPYTAADFATDLGDESAVALLFGPRGGSQALYYTTYADGGQIRRIYYDQTGNAPPTAVASGSPLSGSPPLNVTFSAAGSSDPNPGNTLTFFWTFGDGTPEAQTTSLTIPHTYTALGTYTATLRARDNLFAFSAPVTLQVQVGTNTPPVPTITTPAAGALFRVGQVVTLVGSALDQGSPLPASALSWQVLLHHDTHTHPYFGPATGNNLPFTTPGPEDLQAATNSFLEVRLTATDSGGLSTTLSRDFLPRKVNVTLATSPPGLTLNVNTTTAVTGPTTLVSWEGYGLAVAAPAQIGPGGVPYTFASWSDGGAASHTITTPAAAATFTAVFTPLTVNAGDASVTEGNAGTVTALVPVTLSASHTANVSVGWATADGTASAAAGDYLPGAGTLTFAPGSTSATVPVTVLGDLNAEVDEIVLVNLSSPAAAVIGNGSGEAVIRNDDAAQPPDPSAELAHGSRVLSTLTTQAGPQERIDWYRVSQKARSSYEVVVDAASGDLQPISLTRTAADGTTVRQTALPEGPSRARSLRWQNTGSAALDTELVRVQSGLCATSCGADDVYRVRAYDTTYSIPRFNNVGSQGTVLLIQNTRSAAVAGRVFFWSGAGGLLASQAFNLPSRGTFVLNTLTVAGLPGTSGTITVTSDAPYGTLVGKSVALEPSSGFSFDSPMLPRSR
jgi:glucose/arabinose dehydrogenase